MSIREQILELQAHYRLQQDGIAGPKTWRAIYQDLVGGDPGPAVAQGVTVEEVQRKLGLKTDGLAGALTWAAIHARVLGGSPEGETRRQGDQESGVSPSPHLPISPSPSLPETPASDRSERLIATLLPPVQAKARRLFHLAAENGITIEIISGTRTYAEQDVLYEKGRSKPGSVVTKARAGYSNHNFGLAFDIGIFRDGEYLEESPDYRKVGALGKGLGLAWGGDWKSLQDEPHFELHPAWAGDMSESAMLAELRARHEAGTPVFV